MRRQSLHFLASGILQCDSEESLEEVPEFLGERMAGGSLRKIIPQTLRLPGFSAVGVVPGRVAAVGQLSNREVPRPQFRQGELPQVQVPRREVGPQVADLLLAAAPDLLDVVEELFDRRAVGERLDDLANTRIGAIVKCCG